MQVQHSSNPQPARLVRAQKQPTPPPPPPSPEGNPWTPTEMVVTGAIATGAAAGLGYLGFYGGVSSGALLGLMLTRPEAGLGMNGLLGNITLGVQIGAVAGPIIGALGGASIVYLVADALKNPEPPK